MYYCDITEHTYKYVKKYPLLLLPVGGIMTKILKNGRDSEDDIKWSKSADTLKIIREMAMTILKVKEEKEEEEKAKQAKERNR